MRFRRSSRRRASRWAMPADERRGIWLGIAATLLVHFLLWWQAPRLDRLLGLEKGGGVGERSFQIEMAPDTFRAHLTEETPPSMKFVEVNPDAPENTPDQTRNFGAQDQQLAQPEPTPQSADAAEAPRSHGEDTQQGAAIVSDTRAPAPLPVVPAPAPEAAVQITPDESEASAARQKQIPRFGADSVEGDSPTGVSTLQSDQHGTADKAVDGRPEGLPDGYALLSGRVHVDRNQPQARPFLDLPRSTGRPALLLENAIGTRNIGILGYDAKWSDYGAYLQKLIETVQAQWERQILRSRIYPVAGTKIVVTFVLDRKGAVEKIVKVGGSDDRTAAYLCLNAITDRAPYGEWTEDMVGVLGESQTLTFTFNYR